MRIRKYIYQCGTAFGLFALAACSSEQFEEIDLTPSNTPIQIAGVSTRAGATISLSGYEESGLMLTSRINSNTGSGDASYVNYFKNVVLEIELSTETDKSNLKAINAYYPLSSIPLHLYGHTGKIDDGNKIILKSGKATIEAPLAHDYLVSNGTDGMGTEGHSGIKDQETGTPYATLMTFRHVMTKLEVAIDVTDESLQTEKPKNIKIQFNDNLINKEGKYLITNATGDTDKAIDLSKEQGTNNYELSVGTHYLVPNGMTLSGTNLLSSLIIDDYTATAEDLKNITIPEATIENSNDQNPLVLKPGLAYKLTFKIERLRVVGIKLTVDDWSLVYPQPEWGYDPYKMTLSVDGGYDASVDNNQITQVVLHHKVGDKDYQYVGKGAYLANDDKKTDIEFLSIPKTLDANSVLTVDAYTKHGLLIEGQEVVYISSSTNKGDIKLSLSTNGMVSDEDGHYLISTPLQFHNFLSNPKENTSYRISKNIDMDALREMPQPKEFPSGSTLEGGTYIDVNGVTRTNSILHLNRAGGLFSTNKGTLKNIYIFSGTITADKSTHIGSICNFNEGTIEGCVNEADLVPDTTQTAGGICGENSGTILACLNTGNIQSGKTVGGICGENTKNEAGVIKACISTGMLNKSATHLGGICGITTSTSKIINTCYWLTGTARKNQDINNEIAVGSDAANATCENASDLAPERLRAKDIIDGLSTAASSWSFELEPKICVWPIPIVVSAP